MKKCGIGNKIKTTQTKLIEADVFNYILACVFDKPFVELIVCEAYLNKKDEYKET